MSLFKFFNHPSKVHAVISVDSECTHSQQSPNKSKMALLVLFLRNSLTYLSSFPRTIRFGICENYQIKEDNAFDFDLCLIQALYAAIISIFKALKSDIAESDAEKFAEKGLKSYFWKKNSAQSILLIHKNQENVVLEIELNYFQFNELVHSLHQVIIPAICLKNSEAEFTHFILESEICDFVNLKNYRTFIELVRDTTFLENSFHYYTFFTYYLDIIFILYKLRKFTNFQLLPNNLESLLTI